MISLLLISLDGLKYGTENMTPTKLNSDFAYNIYIYNVQCVFVCLSVSLCRVEGYSSDTEYARSRVIGCSRYTGDINGK